MAKKKAKVSKKKSAGPGIKTTVASTASSVIDEIDKAMDVVVHEIREGFSVVSSKASVAAETIADTTVTVKDTISETASRA